MILASWVPGALGLVLRSRLYPMILGSVGRNVASASTSRFAIRTRFTSATMW